MVRESMSTRLTSSGISMRSIVALGLATCLLAAGCSGPGPHRPALPPSAPTVGATTTGPVLEVPQVMLVWTPGRLPPGFAARVGGMPGVRHAVPVVSGTVWLARSLDGDGHVVDRPPAGMAIPLDLAAAAPQALAPFLPPADQGVVAGLERGAAILGATSARLRRIGAGGTLEIDAPARPGGRSGSGGAARRAVRIAGVVPDQDVGAHELLVSREQAAIPGQTTGLRQGDAVLPQVVEKALLGEFAAKPQPAPGGWITIDPAWVNRHIVTAAVPILGRVTCNRAIIPQLRGALAEVVRRGLAHLVNPADYAGCYAARVIAGDPGPSLAHHAWGSAIDFNATANLDLRCRN